jgi:hypothetical protein
MAILSVTGPLGDSMTISDSLSDGATASLMFRVVSDTRNESPALVMNAVGLPILGDSFPGAPNVILHEKSPARQASDASDTVWLVTFNYKSILSQEERDRKDNENPLDRKSNIFWKSREVMKCYRAQIKRSGYYKEYSAAVEDTFNMKSATNSASDFFEPILEYQFTEWIAVFSKNVATIPDWFLTYQNAVNDADFTIDFYGVQKTIKKGCAKIGSIAFPKAKKENGYEYVQLSFEINIKTPRALRGDETVAPEPWDDEIPDMGMRRRVVQDDIDNPDPKIDPKLKDEDIGKWMNILDCQQIGVTLPVPFDSQGKPIGTPGIAIEEKELWYSLVAPYPRKSFSLLAEYLGP